MEPSLPRSERRAATAERILRAAREEFGERGRDGATIRAIARRADVDPSLVMQHFGSKQELFARAVTSVADITGSDVVGHLSEVLDVRLRELSPATRALLRSLLTSPEAAQAMSAHLQDRAARLTAAAPGEDAALRAAVLVSSILGVTIAHHFLDLPALSAADPDDVAQALGAILPTTEQRVDGDLAG